MKMAFWTVFVVGFVACSTVGIGPVLRRMGGDWMSAPMLAGIMLGVAILALTTLVVSGVRPGMLASDAVALYVLAGLVGAKVLVGALAMTGVAGQG